MCFVANRKPLKHEQKLSPNLVQKQVHLTAVWQVLSPRGWCLFGQFSIVLEDEFCCISALNVFRTNYADDAVVIGAFLSGEHDVKTKGAVVFDNEIRFIQAI